MIHLRIKLKRYELIALRELLESRMDIVREDLYEQMVAVGLAMCYLKVIKKLIESKQEYKLSLTRIEALAIVIEFNEAGHDAHPLKDAVITELIHKIHPTLMV